MIPKPSNDIRHDFLICLILVCSIITVYLQVANLKFVNFDDQEYLTQNSFIHSGITKKSITWAFEFSSKGKGVKTYWHPLTWLDHMIDFQLFGFNPAGHHLMNMAFHIVNTLLLFFLLRFGTGRRWESAFVAALFALHPLNVESIAWVSERKNLLSSFFYFLTIISYFNYVKAKQWLWYLLTFFLMLSGLLSKPMLVTLPFALILLDYWPLNRLKFSANNQVTSRTNYLISFIKTNSSLLTEKLPLFILSGIWVYLSDLSVQNLGSSISIQAIPIKLRAANAILSYPFYLEKMIWPFGLCVFYPYPGEIPIWKVLIAAVFLIITTIAVIYSSHKKPWLFTGWFWYLGTLVPVLGLKQAGLWPAFADRWSYLPLIGIFIIISWGIPSLLTQHGKCHPEKSIYLISIITLILLSFSTWNQTKYWKNSNTLWNHALDVTQNNSVAHTNLGTALKRQGNTSASLKHLRIALKINPMDKRIHYNLGRILAGQGQIGKAIKEFSTAIRIDPNYDAAYNNLGACYVKTNQFAAAKRQYKTAIELNPNPIYWFNLGDLLARTGEFKNSVHSFSQALKIDPSFAKAHKSLADIFVRLHKYEQAISNYKKAIDLKPNFIPPIEALAFTYAYLGEYGKSIIVFKKIIELRPDMENIYYNIACMYAKMNKKDKSLEWLKKAIKKGYHKWEHMKNDKDLDSIRSLQRFKEIVKESL